MEITHSEKMKNIENIMKGSLPGIPGIAPPGGVNGSGLEECLDWEILEICRRNLLLWTELSKVKGENRGLRKMLTGQQIVIDKEKFNFWVQRLESRTFQSLTDRPVLWARLNRSRGMDHLLLQ